MGNLWSVYVWFCLGLGGAFGEEVRMRRYVIVGGVALAVGLLIAIMSIVVLMSPGRRPETWQTALYTYLGYKGEVEARSLRVVTSERATSPERFDAGLSAVSYGQSNYYDIAVDYHPETPTPGVFGLSPAMSRRPVPYPPQEVWCVWVEEAGAPRLVFVNRHEDLYNAAWIVHEGEMPPFSAEFEAGVTGLGCSVSPDGQ